jgi:hypothetical protein
MLTQPCNLSFLKSFCDEQQDALKASLPIIYIVLIGFPPKVSQSPDGRASIARSGWFPLDKMSAPPPEMSKTTREILAKMRKMVPPMLEKFHKGKCLRDTVSASCGNLSLMLERLQARWVELLSLEAARTTLARRTFQPWLAHALGQIWWGKPFLLLHSGKN